MHTSPSHRRHPSRMLLLASAPAVAVVLGGAAPAAAKVPEGWSEPDPVNALDALLLLVAAPLGLFVLITIAVLVPSLARGERLGRPVDSQWVGGPDKDPKELTGSHRASHTGSHTGGASGRW